MPENPYGRNLTATILKVERPPPQVFLKVPPLRFALVRPPNSQSEIGLFKDGEDMFGDNGGGATVLVVEDYADTRLLMRMMLERQGYRVVEAEDGRRAVEVAATESPALIIMDLNLPVMNGFEAAREIHGQAAMFDIPIVAVSAHCKDNYRQQALDAGCLDCIQKPIDPKVMKEVISRYLGREDRYIH